MRYPGAIVLAARAAARCGAGVVTVASARSVVDAIAGTDPNLTFFALAEAQPGVVATASAAQLAPVVAEKVKALLVGPGLAHAPGTDEFVGALLRNSRGTPTVIDADGLNALARTEDWMKLIPPRCVLTPHDGEAARMAGRRRGRRVPRARARAARGGVCRRLDPRPRRRAPGERDR